jgi:hypothetical protein
MNINIRFLNIRIWITTEGTIKKLEEKVLKDIEDARK